MEETPLQVSEAIALINQTLDYAYPVLVIEGEVSSFKLNQGKYIFFDLKDAGGTLSCFMMAFQLRVPLEDGMRVRVVAQPKLTQWGKFSLTARAVQPIGEGALKRSFDLLKDKLEREGLFAPERKRPLPSLPEKIAVISSTQAAGYADFIRILSDRWGGLEIEVAHTLVQGMDAPAQIVRALEHFNQQSELPDAIIIVRGGGSADDLSCFNDEPLVRAIAASRVPVMTGIGHEVDVCLADLVADVRAATPSNAAQLLVPDKREIMARLDRIEQRCLECLLLRVRDLNDMIDSAGQLIRLRMHESHRHVVRRLEHAESVLALLDPRQALTRGYAIVRHRDQVLRSGSGVAIGDELHIELKDAIIETGVTHVKFKTHTSE